MIARQLPGDLETLTLQALDGMSRFRVGQREAVAAAIDVGHILIEVKSRLPHGGWGDWLRGIGCKPRTATQWMRLAETGAEVDEVVERGGIARTLATWGARVEPDPDAIREPPELRELQGVEAELARAKAAYYDALSHRRRLLRRLAAKARK